MRGGCADVPADTKASSARRICGVGKASRAGVSPRTCAMRAACTATPAPSIRANTPVGVPRLAAAKTRTSVVTRITADEGSGCATSGVGVSPRFCATWDHGRSARVSTAIPIRTAIMSPVIADGRPPWNNARIDARSHDWPSPVANAEPRSLRRAVMPSAARRDVLNETGSQKRRSVTPHDQTGDPWTAASAPSARPDSLRAV